MPDYPSEGEQPVITVDDPNQLPDGNTPGTTEVDVTVTYPDGTTDHIKVPVTVGEQAITMLTNQQRRCNERPRHTNNRRRRNRSSNSARLSK